MSSIIKSQGTTAAACDDVIESLCQPGFNYTQTAMTSSLRDLLRDDRNLKMLQSLPFAELECSPYMQNLLCAFYATRCDQEGGRPALFPCRELCAEVKSGCATVMESFGFSWPENLECERFPSHTYGQECNLEDFRVPPLDDNFYGNLKQDHGSCEPITVKICAGSGVLHSQTRTPIAVPFGSGLEDFNLYPTQKEAFDVIAPYTTLLSRGGGCQEFLKPLVCGTYLPACGVRGRNVTLPCKDLCVQARSSCRLSMLRHGLQWPSSLDCNRFPTDEENPECLSALSLGEASDSDVSTSVRVPCTFSLSPAIQPQWLTPDGTPVSSDTDMRVFVEVTDKHVTDLIIEGFIDSVDSGKYTCTAGSFSRSVTLGDISQPAPVNKVSVAEVVSQSILGITIKSVSCTYENLPAFQPKWLNPDGVEITDDVHSRIKVNYVSDSITELSIHDFTDSVDAGTYVCTGAHEDSAVPVEIGDATNMDNTTAPDEGPDIPDQSSCEEIRVPACMTGIAYSSTQIPNLVAENQDFAESLMESFSPILDNACSAYLRPYICSLFLPPCGNRTVAPCQELCLKAVDGCSGPIPESLRESCSSLPKESDDLIECYNVNEDTIMYNTTIPDEGPVITDQSSCEEIRVPACMTGIAYSSTQIPLVAENQDFAESLMESFSPILDNACSAYLRPYICSLFLPPCGKRAVVPCQELCLKAVDGCSGPIPESLRESCSSLPKESDDLIECYNVNEDTIMYNTTIPDEGPVITDQSSCEEIRVPACMTGIAYSSTQIPNLAAENQDFAESLMESFFPILDNACSAYLRPYICSLFLPPCGKRAVAPCQELCLKAVDGCSGPIPESLRETCSSLPKESDDLIECYNVNEDTIMNNTTIPDEGPVITDQSFNDTIMYNTTIPDEGLVIPDQSSCEEIRVPACMTGIAYSSTQIPNLVAENQDFAESLMESFSPILDNACSAYLRPYICSLFLPPCGKRSVVPCQELCLKAVDGCSGPIPESLRESCSSLPKESDDFIECYNVNEDTIMNNTTIPDEGPLITDQSSCEEIRVPACMTGIAYSSTIVPSLTGLSQDDVAASLESFSLILDNACSAYFRPYMCSLFLPPCGSKAIAPCQELCLKAVNDCSSTLAGSFSQGQVTALRDACSSMPSEADDFSECYNVNEVSVDEVVSQTILGITMKSVGCTYNFLPAFQPKWFTPEGVEIMDDVNSPIKVNHVSDSVTELSISDFTDSFVTGTYVCTGAHEDSAVPVVIGDATNMDNTTIPDVPDQSSCEEIRVPACMTGIAYSSTQIPNLVAENQDFAESLMESFSPILDNACSAYLRPYICSLFLPPCGKRAVAPCQELCLKAVDGCSGPITESLRESCSSLPKESDDLIECYNVNEDTIMNNTTIPDEGPVITDQSSCEEIRVPACMTGIAYSSTIVPSLTGLSQDAVAASLESFSLILDNACSAYFRPYMCSLFLPPCGSKAIAPCQELCLKAVNDCASTLAGSFSQGQVTALRDACSSMPSEADDFSECYNVNEVSVDEVVSQTILGITMKSVRCTYNFLPAFQPKWFTPEGLEITDDVNSPIKVNHVSDSVTELSISDFTDSFVTGTYVCTGAHEDSAVPVVIGDATNMDNTTIPDIPDQSWNCSLFEFVCNNRECISSTLVCDNNYDCADESDEAEELCKTSSSGCSVDEHACLLSGECLKAVYWCDGKFDCADNSDEKNCSLLLVVTPVNVSQVSSTRIDVSLECSSLFVYHTVQEKPAWITADGDTIAAGSSLLNTRVEYVNDFTSRLIIEGYTDEANGGIYVCGVYSFAKSTLLGDLNPKQIGENCEEIRVSACMTGIGYSSTYIPSIIGLNQDEVETLMESFSLILDNACSAYFRPYMCSLYLPPCGEKAIIPCQELCLKAVNECASTLAGSFSQTEVTALRDACASMPSEADDSSECYNVNEVSVEELRSYTSLGRTDMYVNCHYNLLPVVQPKWFNPDGVEITDDYTSRIKVHHFSDNVTALSIREFTDSVDAGTYVCTGSHEDSAVPVLIGDTTNMDNTTVSDEGPDHSSCEEIRVPACMTGIAYSSTFVPSLTGLNQDQVAANLENFSLILENACSAYFRPYMCSLYLPPCGEKAVVPCQELCLKAVNDCASTLAGSFSYQEVFALRESCASMPSEADGSSECYNVNEVSVDEVGSDINYGFTAKYAHCNYNLLPVLQPKWLNREGVEITDDVTSRIRVIHRSDSITALIINEFTDSVDAGTYVCTGAREDSAVPVVIGDVTNMRNTSRFDLWTGMPEPTSCEEIRIPECSKGLDYSSAYPRSSLMTQDDVLSSFAIFSSFFNADCSPYFRPYICSLYFPPCRGGRGILPCREMCLKATSECEEILISDPGDVIASMRESCKDLPSESDPSSQCYYVKEVEIGEIYGEASEDGVETYVECTYNLLPELQPKWSGPDGLEIAGPPARVSSVEISSSVTRLSIRDYDAAVDGGTYTCHGRDQTASVDL
ncbi:uncharacterized protein LOC117295337 isoform X3 [Asterias rubens]|uniref:uncharacterized protein LOC117295337 isoform X3 n=1 Tax=Asterias rubens TaxID=7604 RepID=UPI001455505D|nr:uncharacterized protein LOC117295337 isoform X3 [Asterias rubens]